MPDVRGTRGCTGLWADVSELGEHATAPNARDALTAASYVLWVLSGRRFSGICETTEMYTCGEPCGGLGGCIWQVLELPGGQLRGWCASGRCVSQRFVFLANRPVRELVSLRRGGVEYDVSEFAVYDRAYIGPRDLDGCGGLGCWDPCDAEVTYRWGTYPPALGRMAVLALAEQLVRSVECPDQCTLPERITSVSRQGVSFQVFDPQDFMNDGRVGIYLVDMFLKSVNPDRAQKRARVFSPDMMGHRRTWPVGQPRGRG